MSHRRPSEAAGITCESLHTAHAAAAQERLHRFLLLVHLIELVCKAEGPSGCRVALHKMNIMV